jgi:signal peptidase I
MTKRYQQFQILLLSLCIAAYSASCRLFDIQRHRVPSGAMEPTIEAESIVYSKLLSDDEKSAIGRGDIVTFVPPVSTDTVYLKRVVALGGDTIEISDQQLFVNGEPVQADYGKHPAKRGHAGARKSLEMAPQRHCLPSVKVKPGHVFVLGDNWEMSLDSRHFGSVKTSAIISKVLE